MMETVFLKLFNMSITAGWLALAVVLVRTLLKKAPKGLMVVMWALVGIRLILPFSFESVLSLLPSAETVPPDILYSNTPMIDSGISLINSNINPIISESLAPNVGDSVNPMQVITFVASVIWIIGVIAMLLYSAISYIRIHKKVKEAIPMKENIWISDHIATPFIFGILRPRVYLPSSMSEQDVEYVIAHEKAHLKRRDHLLKPFAFLLLTVYWFNPILWVAYILLCRDIELACDEKVIKDMGEEIKKPYSDALINCSVPRKMIAVCPLAFGEVGVKERVKNVLSYKKPAFWIIVIAVISCIMVAVCFLTDPAEKPEDISWPALEEIREGYSTKQAATDGCVVIDGHTLLAGEKFWIDFVNETKEGNPAIVRVYQAYSDQSDNYWVKELSYDGEKYLLRYYTETGDTNEEFLREEEYRYLIRSPYYADTSTRDSYLLADSADVTAEGYYSSIVSSIVRPEYDIYNHCYVIYAHDVDKNYLLNSCYGTAFYDIDGDGGEEKCCLGMGSTSGVFTFTISVYGNDGLKYHNVFCTEFYYLSFVKDENGILRVQGITQEEPPETHLFDIVLNGENIELFENGRMIESASERASAFNFSFTWNTYGVSSYDSKTGTLIKTTHATNPEEYVTTLHLSDAEMSEIYNMILNMDIASYPSRYDPFNDPEAELIWASSSYQDIVLSVTTAYGNKIIECKNVLLFGDKEGYNDQAKVFLALCERICDIIVSSDEWEALPDYEFLYE